MAMPLGKEFHATVNGKPCVVYLSMYDLPAKGRERVRWRYGRPSHQLIPADATVALGRPVDRNAKPRR